MVLSDKDGLFPKLFVTGWAFMECLLFGGLLYGWGSVNFVLKTEGIYADLCPTVGPLNASGNQTIPYDAGTSFNGTVNVVTLAPGSLLPDIGQGGNATRQETKEVTGGQECKPQDGKMALCFTIGSALFCVGCAVLGHVNYKFGTRITRIISFVMFVIGSLMMALISKETPWLMFPGLAFLGIGGLPLLVTNAQVSNLFTKGSSSVVGLLCGGFDMSSAVMLMVKIASENGFSRQNMFFVITALHVLVLVSTFFFLPKDFIKKRESQQGQSEVADEEEVGVELLDSKSPNGDTEKPDASIPSLSSCVKKPMFLTHIVWLCLLQLRFYYFIGTLNQYLSRVLHGDPDKVSYFTNVCYYTMMGGLVTSFFSGIVYDWQKSLFKEGNSERYRKVAPAAVPQGLASLLAVILSILVLIPDPQVLYVTFIIMTLYRSFLYSLGAAFIGEVFPGEYFGMLYGIMIICGGVFGFLQYVFFTWAEAYTGGALHADIFLLGMVFLSFIHPLYLLLSSWKEERKFKVN